jgi:AcrR family transcriptional regulator
VSEPARARPGRRRGASGTREAILLAARARFAEVGYDRATIRAIAVHAGVDPALVMHFFGSKQQLFLAAIELTINPAEAIPAMLEDGLDGLGERLARFYLGMWESSETRHGVAGILRSAFSHEDAAALLRGFLGTEVFGRLAERLPGDDVPLRVELAGSHLIGLAVARYVVKVEPLASADAETVIAAVGPTIQHYLTGGARRAGA